MFDLKKLQSMIKEIVLTNVNEMRMTICGKQLCFDQHGVLIQQSLRYRSIYKIVAKNSTLYIQVIMQV